MTTDLIDRSFLDSLDKAKEEKEFKETMDESWNKAVANFIKTCNKRKLRKAIHDDDEFEEEEEILKPSEIKRGFENSDYIEEDEDDDFEDNDFEYSGDEPETYGGDEVRDFEDGAELENEDEVLVLDRSTKQQILGIVLEKGKEGKISQLDVTKIQNRINRNVPLSKAQIDLIDSDELTNAVVEILEKGQTRVFGDTSVSTLSKAFEHGEEEDSENETDEDERRSRRRDGAMQRNKKDRDYIFTDDNGKKRTVSKSAIYRRVHKLVKSKSMSPLDVVKVENRLNKSRDLPKDFLPALFSSD